MGPASRSPSLALSGLDRSPCSASEPSPFASKTTQKSSASRSTASGKRGGQSPRKSDPNDGYVAVSKTAAPAGRASASSQTGGWFFGSGMSSLLSMVVGETKSDDVRVTCAHRRPQPPTRIPDFASFALGAPPPPPATDGFA